MKILGISAFYHDSAAALLIDGKIAAAAQEERFTRQKHTAAFPEHAIKFCLEREGVTIDELDAVVFYDKPFLKFERLLETYYAFAPRGFRSFLKAIPVWMKEKLFLKKQILDGLQQVEEYDRKKIKLLFTEHHVAHAASAFYPSGYEEAAVLTVDGVGEWCTASMATGNAAGGITMLKEMNFPHSVGLLYSAFTYYLGFRVNSGEYKLMGLAPYGNAESEQVAHFTQIIKEKLVDIKADGSIWLNQQYFTYATGLTMVSNREWEQLFGFARRNDDDELQQHHCNLALAIQQVTEEIVVKMAVELKRITNSKNLCMAGGVALNCVANSKLKELGIFENIYVQPAAGDAGGALGAALATSRIYFNEKVLHKDGEDPMQGTYLGPDFSDKEIEQASKKHHAMYIKYASFSTLCKDMALKLEEGNIVGWFQGRMEFGPRALGNRSILADARSAAMQKKLNLSIKNREGFRPFAPSVLAEDATTFFDLKGPSPYMLFVAPVTAQQRKELPAKYSALSLWHKLYISRSTIPAVTHLDFSARVQTVGDSNCAYRELIGAFKQLTGMGIVVNTSFNVRGEPMVCSPQDAYQCFMSTEMDYLVINNYVYQKTEQPDWQNKGKWGKTFDKD